MSIWVRRVGYLLVLVGLALLSPAADLLPVEVWLFFSQPLSIGEHHQYLRVVPGAAEKRASLRIFGIGSVAIGVLTIAVGWFIKLRGTLRGYLRARRED